MSAFTVRTSLPINAGSIDPAYSRASGVYWIVRYTDLEGVHREIKHTGPQSVKQLVESMGIAFDSVDVTFHNSTVKR